MACLKSTKRRFKEKYLIIVGACMWNFETVKLIKEVEML